MNFELRSWNYVISNIKQNTGQNMGFNSERWDHWLLIMAFCGIAFWGLYLSRQWKKENQRKKAHEKLARRLMREVHPLHVWSSNVTAMDSHPIDNPLINSPPTEKSDKQP
ncbi:MAG: hypothetical protein AAFV90_26165 [Cyanobacteria bacterium J06634_5]